MQQRTSDPTVMAAEPTRRQYVPPNLKHYGSVRELTRTLAAGPNFDGGGGANIYAS